MVMLLTVGLQCTILRNTARRTVGGSRFTLDKRNEADQGASAAHASGHAHGGDGDGDGEADGDGSEPYTQTKHSVGDQVQLCGLGKPYAHHNGDTVFILTDFGGDQYGVQFTSGTNHKLDVKHLRKSTQADNIEGIVETTREEDGDTDVAGPAEVIREEDDEYKACEFSNFELDETSKQAIEGLGQDEKVVVLMPGHEFVIAHGPKRTMLFWLCRDVGMTERINGFLEGAKYVVAHLSFAAFVSILAMAELVPYELTYLMILAFPDALRKFLKLNTEAVALVLRELDFWTPFVTMCISLFCAWLSFAHDEAGGGKAAAAALLVVMFSYTVNVLLADADLAARVVKSKASRVVKYVAAMVIVSLFSSLLIFGLVPRSENQKYMFNFIHNKVAMESVSMFSRFMSTPLLFLAKFICKSLVYKGRTIIVKIPLVRHVLLKREVLDFLRQRQEGRSERARAMEASLRADMSAMEASMRANNMADRSKRSATFARSASSRRSASIITNAASARSAAGRRTAWSV